MIKLKVNISGGAGSPVVGSVSVRGGLVNGTLCDIEQLDMRLVPAL